MKHEDKIDDCPFCPNGKGVYTVNGDAVYVLCLDCGARGPVFRISDKICAKDEAINGWNRRKTE